jgi:hypothetical protein
LNAPAVFALKLVLTPLLVGAASLAGRKWGPSVGGWLIGIPFTSGPVVFFLALNPGPRFAALAAEATMAGAISQAAFCLAYSWTAARFGWSTSLLAATVGYAAATVLLIYVPLRGGLLFVLIVVVLAFALLLMPLRGIPPPSSRVAFPGWDLPARMVVATAFVVVLTGLAPALGPRLAGLLAPFPLYGAVLAGFAHRFQGAGSAVGVLRGLLLGLFAFAAFFLVLSGLLPYGIGLAFGLAIAAALAVQSGSLLAGRRLGVA